EQHDGVESQRARDGRALLLTTRERRRLVLRSPAEANAGKQFLCADTRPTILPAGDAQRHHHVLERGKLTKQMMKLEYESHRAISQRRQILVGPAGQRLAVDSDVASRWL